MIGSSNIRDWIFFLLGSVITLAFSLVLGVILPLVLIPVLAKWALIPFAIGGGVILLLYYIFVVFGFSWIYEQFTQHKPDYWFCSFYLLIIALVFHVFLFYHHDVLNERPFSYWGTTKGWIMIVCLIPAWFRILGVTLVGAFYRKLY